jgi:hypothetical protein
MRSKRSRIALMGVLALALSVTVGVVTGAEAAKKKKSNKASFSQTKTVNVAIPDDVAVGASVPVRTNITLGKKFKGKVVTDVNAIVQTTGNIAGAAADLNAKLSAPNGRTVIMFESVGDISLGPWKLDDDTRTQICDQVVPPACTDPDATLNRPFAGTSNLNDDDDDVRPLSTLNGVGMKGNWTLTIYDGADVGQTSTLNKFGLEIKGIKAPK